MNVLRCTNLKTMFLLALRTMRSSKECNTDGNPILNKSYTITFECVSHSHSHESTTVYIIYWNRRIVETKSIYSSSSIGVSNLWKGVVDNFFFGRPHQNSSSSGSYLQLPCFRYAARVCVCVCVSLIWPIIRFQLIAKYYYSCINCDFPFHWRLILWLFSIHLLCKNMEIFYFINRPRRIINRVWDQCGKSAKLNL